MVHSTKTRKDGVETRSRILEAACAVFAEQGFRDTTINAICQQAKTNTASVNYHFSDKCSLYVEVWRHAAERAVELYPIDGGVSPAAPPAERLRGHIRALLQRMTDSGRLGHFHRLHAMELANPTGILDRVIREIRQPHREQVIKVLQELLGTNATPRDIELCELSIIGQCLRARYGTGSAICGSIRPLTKLQLDELVDHITTFSIAGIGARRAERANGPRHRLNGRRAA